MHKLQILGMPQSTFVRTACMAAIEKGIDYELIETMPQSDAMKAIHPAGKMPVMSHGDVHLFETLAITHYIDHAFDGPALHPANPLKQAKMYQWISFSNDRLYQVIARGILLPRFFPNTEDGQPDMALINQSVEEARPLIAALEQAYDGHGYLLGEECSLADLFVAPILYYLYVVPEGGDLFANTPNIERAANAMKERESFIKSAPPPLPQAAD